ITVRTLARAIERRLGGTTAEALNEARTVMSYFGFASQIIDNVIQPEDRKLFYNLADAGLLQTFWETVPLLDGRNWRIFYWSLNDRDIDRILSVEESRPDDPLYKTLPDEAYDHGGLPATRCREIRLRSSGEAGVPLDRNDVLRAHDRRKERGMVAGARPDLEDPLSRFEGRFLEHDRDHRRRRDRLAGSDRKGDVLIGLVQVIRVLAGLAGRWGDRSPSARTTDGAG